jgi:GT2 family glycosyltransferase
MNQETFIAHTISPAENVDSAPVDLAICIVAHNARDDLEVCLTRLHEVMPAGLSVRVTVVDNTGADGSSDYVRRAWPQVHIITNRQPQGLGANVNQAVADANTRYLLSMNPDVVLLPNAIETLVAYMDSHPEVGACGPKTLYPDGALQATSRQFPNWATVFWRWLKLDKLWQPAFYRRFLMADWDHNNHQPVDWLMGSCILLRTSAFAAVRGFDPSFFLYYEDIDLCRRLWQAGYSVHYVPDAVVVHKYQRHSARRLINPLTLVHINSILQYRRKHGMPVGQVRNRRLLAQFSLILAAGDLVLTAVALQIGRYLRLWFPFLGAYPYPVPSPLKPLVYWIVPVIWLAVFALLGLFRMEHLRNYRRELGRLFAGVMLAGLVFAGSLYALFLYEIYVPRLLLAYFLAVDFGLLALERAGLRYLLSRNGLFYQPRTLIVGTGEIGKRLAAAMSADARAELNLIGTLPWQESQAGADSAATVNRLVETVHRLAIDEVILTPPHPGDGCVHSLMAALQTAQVGVRIVPEAAAPGGDYTPEPLYGVWTLRMRSTEDDALPRWLRRLAAPFYPAR